MKINPTGIDREAATLFAPAPGMRVHVGDAQDDALVRVDWCRVAESTWAGGLLLHRLSSSQALASCVDIIAIDTDDPATAGVMLSQVEATHGSPVDVVWRWKTAGTIEYVAEWCEGDSFVDTAAGPTRGAALVAAMRKFKEGQR